MISEIQKTSNNKNYQFTIHNLQSMFNFQFKNFSFGN
jgi:hypothetical protein